MRLVILGLVALTLAWAASAYAMMNDIWGTPWADVIQGSQNADTIHSLGGPDLVDGRGGNDKIWGGRGADELWGYSGNDRLYAGPGAGGPNQLYGEAGADTVGMDNGIRDVATGGAGQDTAYADPIDDYVGFEKVIINGVCRKGC